IVASSAARSRSWTAWIWAASVSSNAVSGVGAPAHPARISAIDTKQRRMRPFSTLASGGRGDRCARSARRGERALEPRHQRLDLLHRDGADGEAEPAVVAGDAERLERHGAEPGLAEEVGADVLVGLERGAVGCCAAVEAEAGAEVDGARGGEHLDGESALAHGGDAVVQRIEALLNRKLHRGVVVHDLIARAEQPGRGD